MHYISFARNFGKEAAIYAGLKNSTADYIALMDADLQHPPELLLDMVKGIEEGYECCGARRVNRNGEPPIRSAFSRLFYSMAAKLTSTKMEQGTTDYRLMSRRFVNAVLKMCLDRLYKFEFLCKRFVHSRLLCNLCDSSVKNLNIGKDQL